MRLRAAALGLVGIAATAHAGARVVDGHDKLTTVVKYSRFAGVTGATIDGALYVVHIGDGTATRIDLETLVATELVYPRRSALRRLGQARGACASSSTLAAARAVAAAATSRSIAAATVAPS